MIQSRSWSGNWLTIEDEGGSDFFTFSSQMSSHSIGPPLWYVSPGSGGRKDGSTVVLSLSGGPIVLESTVDWCRSTLALVLLDFSTDKLPVLIWSIYLNNDEIRWLKTSPNIIPLSIYSVEETLCFLVLCRVRILRCLTFWPLVDFCLTENFHFFYFFLLRGRERNWDS